MKVTTNNPATLLASGQAGASNKLKVGTFSGKSVKPSSNKTRTSTTGGLTAILSEQLPGSVIDQDKLDDLVLGNNTPLSNRTVSTL